MKILIVYGSTEGQTQKICTFALQHLAEGGHSSALCPAGAADGVDPADFEAAILGASIHAGRYQAPFIEFAKTNARTLNAMKTLFLSVSLAAAGDDSDDWAALKRISDQLTEETGWTPGRTEHIPGAFRFSEYDFFKYWAMRWIESQKEPGAKLGEDLEYTDWSALRTILDDWAGPGR